MLGKGGKSLYSAPKNRNRNRCVFKSQIEDRTLCCRFRRKSLKKSVNEIANRCISKSQMSNRTSKQRRQVEVSQIFQKLERVLWIVENVVGLCGCCWLWLDGVVVLVLVDLAVLDWDLGFGWVSVGQGGWVGSVGGLRGWLG